MPSLSDFVKEQREAREAWEEYKAGHATLVAPAPMGATWEWMQYIAFEICRDRIYDAKIPLEMRQTEMDVVKRLLDAEERPSDKPENRIFNAYLRYLQGKRPVVGEAITRLKNEQQQQHEREARQQTSQVGVGMGTKPSAASSESASA